MREWARHSNTREARGGLSGHPFGSRLDVAASSDRRRADGTFRSDGRPRRVPPIPNGRRASTAVSIAAVSMRPDTFLRVKSIVNAVIGHERRLIRFESIPHDPDEFLDSFNLFLFGEAFPLDEWARDGRLASVHDRSRVVVDLRYCTARELWAAGRSKAVPLLVVGTPEADVDACAQLEHLVSGDPIREAVARYVHHALSGRQASLLLEFVRRSDLETPLAVARELAVSLRTVRRWCKDAGLQSPQRLLSTSRVMAGIAWMIRSGGGLARAAHFAGYSEPTAFGRASRRCFGQSPSRLMRDWADPEILKEHLRGAVLAK